MNHQVKELYESHQILGDPKLTEKQRAIIQAALELFAEKGYAGTTTQAIAQKAKVSEKTLFKHFGSKEKLFKQTVYPAMLQALQPILVERIEQILRQGNNYQDILYALMKDRVEFAIENTDIIKLVLQELLLSEEFRQVMSKFVKQNVLPRISGIFHSLGKEVVPVSSLIRVILSLLTGYVFTRTILEPEQEWNDEKEIQFMLNIFFHGIESTSQSRFLETRSQSQT